MHDWTSRKYIPLDILNMCILSFGLPGNECTKTEKKPKKSAAFGGRLLVLFWGLTYNHFLEVQNKIYTYDHLCINISIFDKSSEFPNFLPDCY